MNAGTRSAISTLLAADPAVPSERISLALDFLAGRKSLSADPASKQEFLTVSEACDLLRCSRTTLFREEQENRI